MASKANWASASAANQCGPADPAGAQFAFVDGSVRLLCHGTPPAVMQALLTPAGGEVVPDLDD
jgi:prepilin-type processing-associated H-X9-DG protein